MGYRDRIYKDYRGTHARADTPSTRELADYEAKVYRKTFGALLPADRRAAIFEVGSGWGSFVDFLRKEGYANAFGMDQDARHLETAADLGIRGVTLGDAVKHLEAKPGAYDCVVAIDVVEHLTKDELFPFLDLVKAALKPGGAFLWRAPNADGPFFGRVRYGDLTHELAFTRNSAWQAMRAAGFTGIEILAEEPVATGARSLLRVLLWKALKPLVKLYLFAESYAHADCLLTANLIVRARKEQP